MNSHDVLTAIDAIAATGSRNEKEELVERHIADPLFKRVLIATYDTFTTYGVTPPKVKTFGSLSFDMESDLLWHGLGQLARRELTGNAAKTWVKNVLESHDEPSSQLLYRILDRDLRAGFGKNTVNRVLPGTIVTFDVMLSKGYEAKRIKAWPVAVEPKLDGLRAMSLCKDGESKAFSRVGKHFPALDHLSGPVAAMVRAAWEKANELRVLTPIHEAFWKMLGGAAGPTLAIDAEAISGSFNQTVGDVKRKSVQAEGTILHVFDCLPYDLVTADDHAEIKIPYKLRRKFTEFVVGHAAEDAPIVTTPMELATSDEEILAIYQRHRDAGLEGAMVKPLTGSYHKKRHYDLMKLKAEETEDLRIIGWFQGKPATRLEGKFAGFIVGRNGVHVNIGGGFSHQQLEDFNRDVTDPALTGQNLVGRLIEVEYHEVTPDGSLRHPRFVRFRDDKDDRLRVAA